MSELDRELLDYLYTKFKSVDNGYVTTDGRIFYKEKKVVIPDPKTFTDIPSLSGLSPKESIERFIDTWCGLATMEIDRAIERFSAYRIIPMKDITNGWYLAVHHESIHITAVKVSYNGDYVVFDNTHKTTKVSSRMFTFYEKFDPETIVAARGYYLNTITEEKEDNGG